MQTVIDLGDQDIYREVKQFLHLFVVGEVVQGWDKNVPMPLDDHVVMRILFKSQIATNNVEYNIDDDTARTQQSTSVTMQLDFFGQNCDKHAQMFVTLWRDFYGTENMVCVQPLYCDDARLLPLVNETSQYEHRYIVTAVLQYNPVTTTNQPFVDEVNAKPLNVI